MLKISGQITKFYSIITTGDRESASKVFNEFFIDATFRLAVAIFVYLILFITKFNF